MDLSVLKGALNSNLFPGNSPSGIEVHTGFRDEQALTVDEIQAAVKSLIASQGANQVTVVKINCRPLLLENDCRLPNRLDTASEVPSRSLTPFP